MYEISPFQNVPWERQLARSLASPYTINFLLPSFKFHPNDDGSRDDDVAGRLNFHSGKRQTRMEQQQKVFWQLGARARISFDARSNHSTYQQHQRQRVEKIFNDTLQKKSKNKLCINYL
jgi:hypothetical protein